MRPEERIEHEVCRYAREKDIIPLKMQVPGQKGWPDRQFLMSNGFTFFIEFKAIGGRLSEHQHRRIKTLEQRNFAVFVIDDVDQGKMVIDGALERFSRHVTGVTV